MSNLFSKKNKHGEQTIILVIATIKRIIFPLFLTGRQLSCLYVSTMNELQHSLINYGSALEASLHN